MSLYHLDHSMEQILKADEVARELRAGTITIYRLARQGKLPGFRINGRWRFQREELDRWIAQHTIGGGA